MSSISSRQTAGTSLASATGVIVPSDWGKGTGGYKAKLKAAMAGTGKCSIAIVGDSKSGGFHFPTTYASSWVGRLATRLQGAAGSAGDGGSGFVGVSRTATYQTAKSYSQFLAQHGTESAVVTQTGTWALGSSTEGPGGAQLQSSTNGSTLTFKARGSKITVYYVGLINTGTNGGPFTVSVDGGTATNLTSDNGASASAVKSAVVATGLSTAEHTVVITCTAPDSVHFTVICGVSGENATGVVINNYARGSARTSEYATATAGIGTAQAWCGGDAYPCDLLLYANYVNDAKDAITAATWAGYIKLIQSRVRETVTTGVDTLFILPHVGAYGTSTRTSLELAAQARSLASTYGAAIVDFWALGRNQYAAYTALGYWGDQTVPGAAGTDVIHESDAGHVYFESVIGPLLLA